MRPNDDAQLLDEKLLGTLTGFVQVLATTEPSFGHATALLKYGRGYSSLAGSQNGSVLAASGNASKMQLFMHSNAMTFSTRKGMRSTPIFRCRSNMLGW